MSDNDPVFILEKEIAALEEALAEEELRLPAHSIRPHQLIKVEELENSIAELKAELMCLKKTD